MAKTPLTFNDNETNLLIQALDMAIASNKRAQNTAKNPQFSELHKKLENEYNALKIKVS